jgi:hypothetical protein
MPSNVIVFSCMSFTLLLCRPALQILQFWRLRTLCYWHQGLFTGIRRTRRHYATPIRQKCEARAQWLRTVGTYSRGMCAVCRMQGDSKLQVWVEVLGPFKFLPREVLQGTANTVLAGLMRTLLPIFTRKCAPDMNSSTAFMLNPMSRHAVLRQTLPEECFTYMASYYCLP